ncbi:LysM peptidoglycan-binding domain-containing protein [Oceanobacillus senegalensis]|uniref:LysM peptidoglycan-binding domain-containing protein n=1 Tax=Oceanobacillus senegalensis TaxID=1936063 RepID=UPI000A312413|nr:LysM peptidoglycan-binding domain-containing protein [Oceanobacillus senegalensis]
MKRLVALLVGFIIIGITATTVSAAEHEVQNGDTLWDIAIKYDTTVEALMNDNKLDSSLIFPKQVLKITEDEREFHIVKKGDTLKEISQSYGEDVTVTSLMVWNDLTSDLIVTGEKLLVEGEEVSGKEAKQVEQLIASSNVEIKEKKPSLKVKSSTEVVESKSHSKQQTSTTESNAQEKVNGKTLTVEATAYTAYCAGCSGITATGVNLKENPNAKVIAVDPNVIPLGSKVYVEGYGEAIAADTGGAINGNKIDVHVPTKDEAYNWGRRTVEVTVIE